MSDLRRKKSADPSECTDVQTDRSHAVGMGVASGPIHHAWLTHRTIVEGLLGDGPSVGVGFPEVHKGVNMRHNVLVGFVLTVSGMAGSVLPAWSQDGVTQPIARVESIVVTSVTVNNGQLQANATVTLDVVGNTVTQNVVIPLDLGGTAGTECDILNLAVGPLGLDLLGLAVDLDDCEESPITVDITAMDSGLLGSLLCDIAGDLVGGTELSVVLSSLTSVQVTTLTGGIRDLLNEIFVEVIITGSSSTGDGDSLSHTDILLLEIPEGLQLSVLGLEVQTSGICLDVYAERGLNKSLGNLLSALTRVLESRAGDRAANALVRLIERVLEQF